MILEWPITLNKQYIFFYIYSSLFYQIFVCRKIRKSYKSKKMFQYFSEKRFISKLFFTYWYGKKYKNGISNKIKKEINIISMKKKMMQIIQ